MKFIPHFSDRLKGVFLIIAGAIILFDTLGFATELLHSIVLFGSIAMIVLGVFMSNIHRTIFSLISKGDKRNDSTGDKEK